MAIAFLRTARTSTYKVSGERTPDLQAGAGRPEGLPYGSILLTKARRKRHSSSAVLGVAGLRPTYRNESEHSPRRRCAWQLSVRESIDSSFCGNDATLDRRAASAAELDSVALRAYDSPAV